MSRVSILAAMKALNKPSTKEDILIDMAKQTNVPFNELPQLNKDVTEALRESLSLDFLHSVGFNKYKLAVDVDRPIHGD